MVIEEIPAVSMTRTHGQSTRTTKTQEEESAQTRLVGWWQVNHLTGPPMKAGLLS